MISPSSRAVRAGRRVGLALLLGLALLPPGTGAGDHDWPRFLGPGLDGRSSQSGIRRDWSGDKLPRVWERSVGEGYSMPSVADGRLYHFDRWGDRARLVALDARTGEEIWRHEYTTRYEDRFGFSNGPRASPVIDGERVYTFGVEGRLRAHRTTDGELLWEVDTASEFDVVQNFFGVGSTPVVEGDLLIVMVGGSPADEGSPDTLSGPTGDDGEEDLLTAMMGDDEPSGPPVDSGMVAGAGSGVVAFDKLTGEVRYRITDELASYSSIVTHSHGGRRWAFAFARGGLVGFEPVSGEVDFHFPWRSRKVYSVNASSPVVVDDTVLITESYGPGSALLRFRAGGYELVRADEPRSRERSLAAHWATPVHHRGHLYGSSGEKSGSAELRCVDHMTGEVGWSRRGFGRTTLMFVDQHLVVLNEWANLMLIEARCDAFRLVTEASLERLGNPTWSAPILADGLLYLLGAERLMALELIPSSAGDQLGAEQAAEGATPGTVGRAGDRR